jgi:hypothetical protein
MKAILTVGFLQEVEGTEQELNIDEIYLHEQYNKNMCLNNDIAVVKVKGLGIQLPACLPATLWCPVHQMMSHGG